jgi:hypothetical protein
MVAEYIQLHFYKHLLFNHKKITRKLFLGCNQEFGIGFSLFGWLGKEV